MDDMKEMDNVSRKVLDDARARAEETVREAKEKASRIIAEAETRKAENIARGRSLADNRYREVFGRELSRIRADMNQRVLLKKLEIVERVIAEAREKLSGLNAGQYEKFIKKAFDAQGIKKGTYITGKNEKLLDDRIIMSMAELEKDDRAPDFDRGIKVIDGKAEFMLSPESYMDTDIEDLRMEIASFLFGKEK